MKYDSDHWYLIKSETGEPLMQLPAASETQARHRAELYSLAYPQFQIPDMVHVEVLADVQESVRPRLGMIPLAFFEAYELIEAGMQRARQSGIALQVILPPELEQ
jgi:hypothetical protein